MTEEAERGAPFGGRTCARPHRPALHPLHPRVSSRTGAGLGDQAEHQRGAPILPAPRWPKAILREVGSGRGASLRLYPDPTSAALRAAVAKHHGLTAAQVCIGNGSDDILNLLVRCFCGPGQPRPASRSRVIPCIRCSSAIQDGAVTRIPNSTATMRLPAEEIAASGANVFFLTSPNAPTGMGFANAEIEADS